VQCLKTRANDTLSALTATPNLRTLRDTSDDADFIDLNAACERQNYSCTLNLVWQSYGRISVVSLSAALHKAHLVYRKLDKVKLINVIVVINSH